MDAKLIKAMLDRFHPLSSTSFRSLFERMETLELAAGETFITKGRPEEHEYIVMEGICRSFLLDPEGEEITLSFFAEEAVLSPYITRTQGGVSTINYQAISDCTLVRFSASYFEELMVENLEFRAWGNEVLKYELAQKVEKEIELASLTAKERLVKTRVRFPGLENRVPHPAIASYLGIATVSLSRLRKDVH